MSNETPQWPEPPTHAVWVDARGELCPWPLLKSKQALASLSAGQRIVVWATDPLAELDLRALCARAQHQLLSLETSPWGLIAEIEKADSATSNTA